MDDNKSVLVFVEVSDENKLKPVSLESLNTGRKLADDYGGTLTALIIGSQIGDPAEELRHYNPDTIYVVDHPDLNPYRSEYYLAAIKQAVDRIPPAVILMGHTLTSIDLAPRIALSSGTGIVTECVDLVFDGGKLLVSKPVFSGNIIARYLINGEPQIITLRAKSFDPAERTETKKGEIVSIEAKLDEIVPLTTVVKRELEKGEGPKLDTANIIVACGRGIGDEENVEIIAELSKTLGAALAASRPPVDLGWVPAKLQVGQTGTIVAPELYIAIAISGSAQHAAGMSESKTIVAINEDEKANIFKISDYGIVGDFEEVVPAFNQSLKEIMKEQSVS